MSPLGLVLGISRIVSQWPIRCYNVPLLLAKLVERLHNNCKYEKSWDRTLSGTLHFWRSNWFYRYILLGTKHLTFSEGICLSRIRKLFSYETRIRFLLDLIKVSIFLQTLSTFLLKTVTFGNHLLFIICIFHL